MKILAIYPPGYRRMGPPPVDSWWLRWDRLNLAVWRSSRPVQGRLL